MKYVTIKVLQTFLKFIAWAEIFQINKYKNPSWHTTFRSQVNSCGICGAQKGTSTDVFRVFPFSLLVFYHQCFILINSSITDARGLNFSNWQRF